MRAHDWARTSLGSPEHWPQSLRTAVSIMLTSSQPIWIGWGRELIYLYNDAYKSIIGGKHPWALGKPASVVWSEIWSDIGPLLDTALKGDAGIYVEAQLLIMERNGYPEETYYTFSYSPIPADDGTPGGIFCANTDDTPRVLSERQLGLLRELAAAATSARTAQQACAASSQALARDAHDLPFALLYLIEPGGSDAILAGQAGIEPGHPVAPSSLPLDASTPWPVADVLRDRAPKVVYDFASQFGSPLPKGAWDEPTRAAVVLPIAPSAGTGRSGFLIAGLNPFRLYEGAYAAFLDLVAGQIAASIASAEAYEEERRRAEALAEIDRTKTLFFSNVSHEFRTPLTLMLSPLEEVLSKPVEDVMPDNRQLVAVAYRNGVRLLKLVNALLDFSRIEAGRTEARLAARDLSALTSDLASTFSPAIERAGLTLTVDCPPLPHPVRIDREMWEKIVLNLLSNALKFTFEGGITVAVRPEGGMAVVTVGDTGTGIPQAELPHLFERFHRVEGARGRSIEGSGIGLALVLELVKLHDGTIEVQSELDKGSSFTIRLPMVTSVAVPGEATTSASTAQRAEAYLQEATSWLGDEAAANLPPASLVDDLPPSSASEPANGQLVLLADDNLDMRAYVGRLLRGAGYRVEAVPDGEAALAAARALKPGLVLSDIMMPKLDGIGLMNAMRADPELKDIPVILLSARAGEEAKVEGLRAGADDYLTKPFSARELVARVESNLRLATTRRENERTLRAEAEILEELYRVGITVSAELDLERAVQAVTDSATTLIDAQFGSFFYNAVNASGEAYMLYALSGAPREAFSKFPMPRITGVFAPTFAGEGVVRSADIRQDPRFGKNAPYNGQPKGHLPVVSYLAVPVVSRTGQVLGGLLFGHSEAGVFDDRAERIVSAIAVQAAIAIDKARLYQSAQDEIERRRKTEAALQRSEQSLEQKVRERTAELADSNAQLVKQIAEREEAQKELVRAQEQLAQAQKMEGIGQLTGGVAHDFNNLLTVILGNLETAQRASSSNPNPDRLARALEHATLGAQRAASLTQRLLAFSRRSPLDPKPIEASRLVSGMSELLRRTLGEQIVVETVLAGGLWRVHADPNQLEIGILNLAVNARDAMPDGGRLTIETANAFLDEAYAATQSEVVPGQYVVISISDTGIGMDRETMARAFEPFFTTKDIGHGTGLGLSQVYGFAKQSGGHIKLYSEPGNGTTVKLYLPRLLSSNESDVLPVTPTQAPGSVSGETILVVEDDPDVRANTTGILRELNYKVLEAPLGSIALHLIETHPEIDLLFSDVGLPGGMDGKQLADAAHKIRPGLRVLFTTGYARNAIVHGGRLDPGVQLLPKPFTYAAVATKLAEILGSTSKEPRVLLVEDEILVQMVAQEQLEDLGCKVEVAGSVTEALDKVRRIAGGIDLAIVDIGLPDRKGDVLAAELRALYPKLPIVIASGYGDAGLRDRFKDDAHITFVGKPYAMEDLRKVVEALPGQ
jgi:signal transduction histidine kinase/DNA-binding response OmpR family regulator